VSRAAVSTAVSTAPLGVAAELAAIRIRTRRGVGASFLAHVGLLLLLKLTAPSSAPVEGLVEITWLEASSSSSVSAPPTGAARVTQTSPEGAEDPAKPGQHSERRLFVREIPEAEISPKPQRSTTSRDAVRDRLASLRRDAAETRTLIAALLPRAEAARPMPAVAPVVRDRSPSGESLVRGESKRSSPRPADLIRAEAVPAPSMNALARLIDEPAVPAPPPTSSTTAFPPREVLAGISLAGPVADRALLNWRLPTYPEWAKRNAVEGAVRLRFVVRPDGGVKEGIMVEKTSGHEDFDGNATLALLDWRFESLHGATGEQWGSVTLEYRLDGLH
jgi:TonB family protein